MHSSGENDVININMNETKTETADNNNTSDDTPTVDAPQDVAITTEERKGSFTFTVVNWRKAVEDVCSPQTLIKRVDEEPTAKARTDALADLFDAARQRLVVLKDKDDVTVEDKAYCIQVLQAVVTHKDFLYISCPDAEMSNVQILRHWTANMSSDHVQELHKCLADMVDTK